MHLIVSEGSKVIEVKHGHINKGRAAKFWTSEKEWDFIMAIGDDWTDEDLFDAMPEEAYSIKVGMGITKARFYVVNHHGVRNLLKKLVRVK